MDRESHYKSLQEVHDFWEKFACGEIYADGESLSEKYRNETLARYRLEPYILEFADFPSFKDLDVLEIGVGMGSDHSSIAAQKPKSLSGVDLTSRSIEKTQERFDLFQLQS